MASSTTPSRPHQVARSFALTLAVLAGMTAHGMAQTTHVVGTGGTYPTIRAAIAAAAAGDTVLVNGGTWQENLDIDRGIRLIGRGAVLRDAVFGSPVWIHDVPRGETFVLAGFQADPTAGAIDSRVTVVDCAGLVSIRNLTQGGLQQWFLQVADSAQVHVGNSVFAGGRIDDSTAVVEGCVFDPDLLHALTVHRSQLAIVGSTLRGGFGVFPGEGIVAIDSELALTGSNVSATGQNKAAIHATGGAVLLAPNNTLAPTGSQPAIAGNTAVAPYHFASTTAATTGQLLTFAADGPPGSAFLTLLSLPQPVTATAYGFAWIDPVHWGVLQAGTFPTGPGTLAHPILPPGLAVAIQTVHLTPANLVALSTPTVVVAP